MKYLFAFNLVYVMAGGVYFLQDANSEFVIYVAVIAALLGLVYIVHVHYHFPAWMLWAFSVWGLMHVLGGAVTIGDHVLFAHRFFPLVDAGNDLYILKYDQVVHAYLYGLVAIMSFHVLSRAGLMLQPRLLFLAAVLTSLGISGLNEIMEFGIALSMENGVGGYNNTMLDMCFNLAGALMATTLFAWHRKQEDGPVVTLGA